MSAQNQSILQSGTFQKLQIEAMELLQQVAAKRSYPAGTVLCRQGEIEHTFYVVVTGHVEVTQTLGQSQTVRRLGECLPRDFFGALALLDNTARIATCTTTVETTVLEISEDLFDDLIQENPALAYTILGHVLTTLREKDRHTIEELTVKNEALQIAYAQLQAAQADLVEKERLEHELEIAANVQRSLLPSHFPATPPYTFAAHLEAARQVGGDFYDVFQVDEEHVAFLLADVADKSIHAALFMAVTRTLFLVEGRRSTSPAAVAQAVHQGILDVSAVDEIFVTAFYAVLHIPSATLRYVIAGHERPLWLRPNEPITTLPGKGRFLGMLPELTLTEYSVTLHPGDKIVVFSDGLPDALNAVEENYGYERLYQLLTNVSAATTEKMVSDIIETIHQWGQGVPLFDDLTVLAMSWHQTPL